MSKKGRNIIQKSVGFIKEDWEWVTTVAESTGKTQSQVIRNVFKEYFLLCDLMKSKKYGRLDWDFHFLLASQEAGTAYKRAKIFPNTPIYNQPVTEENFAELEKEEFNIGVKISDYERIDEESGK